ncbi:MAG: dienelactone hydrolase family protein [Candidatus Lernaella stagnicola]|nr:dienelactone hydrolase family protein [Candidatus Lernaella stagnicola]
MKYSRFRFPRVLLGFLLLVLTVAGCGSDDTNNQEDSSSVDLSTPWAELTDFFPPEELGPYDVGVTTLMFIDESRWEVWGDMPRTLPVEVWYPAAGPGDTNTTMDMVGPIPKWAQGVMDAIYGDLLPEVMGLVTKAGRDAPPIVLDQPFPLIIFSHGLSAIRFQNFTLCEHLASHGFVVVSPDHYANAIFTNIPDEQVVILNPLSTLAGVYDRLVDIQFVYDTMQNLPAESGDISLVPPIDFSHVGMTGHSYGGLTTMQAGAIHPFIDAIAPLNPIFLPWYPHSFNKPFLMLQSEFDEIVGIGNEATRRAFDMAEADYKLHINLLRGSHYSATDACSLVPEMFRGPERGCDVPTHIPVALANQVSAGYVTAFFKRFVAEDVRYEDYLLENRYPEEVETDVFWPE